MKYVLSTMTSNVAYNTYNYIGDLPVPDPALKIRIFGGTGIPSNTSGFGIPSKSLDGTPLWTPAGMITPITDEQYERLKDHPIFKKHYDAGFVKFVDHDISGSHKLIEKAVGTMKRDGFQQHTKDSIKEVRVTLGNQEENDPYRK